MIHRDTVGKEWDIDLPYSLPFACDKITMAIRVRDTHNLG
jgi:hypothetical protein